MILWLFKNWKAVVAVALTASLAYGLHSLRMSSAKAGHAIEMERQRTALVKACAETQQRSAKVSHEYQNEITRLNRTVADRKRLYRNACASVTFDAGGRRDGGAGADLDGGQTRLLISDLYDFAGEAEGYRLRLKACQQFVRGEWAAHGYSIPGTVR
jgi:hypothetical protein